MSQIVPEIPEQGLPILLVDSLGPHWRSYKYIETLGA